MGPKYPRDQNAGPLGRWERERRRGMTLCFPVNKSQPEPACVSEVFSRGSVYQSCLFPGHVRGWAGGIWNNSIPLNSSGEERSPPLPTGGNRPTAHKLLWDKQLMGLEAGGVPEDLQV